MQETFILDLFPQPAIERVVRNIMKTTHEMAKVHRRGEDLRTEIDTLKRDLASKSTSSPLWFSTV